MVGGNWVKSSALEERVIVAPVQLDLATRLDFRGEALRCVEGMRRGSGRLVVDLTATRSVDSTGLGVLIMIQRRAAQRRLRVALRGVNDDLRFLLTLTKLEDRFQVETPDTG
jgi:anti-anti-sigma factor